MFCDWWPHSQNASTPTARRAALLPALVISAFLLATVPAWGQAGSVPADEGLPTVNLQQALISLKVVPKGGTYEITLKGADRPITPEELARLIYVAQSAQHSHGRILSWVFVVFNITTWGGLWWVSVGLLGQLLFTFRMVLQWLTSEREKRSVVPVGFWWGSLLGGILLLTYFIWRKDAVGIIGQATGAVIYARNLVLIYRNGDAQTPQISTRTNSSPAN